jgi:hypothetical protein
VTNGPGNPVPVTINGTSTVSGSVEITNTPTVKIAGAPYAVESIGSCNSFFCFFTFPAVPTGKQLVITHINVTVRPTLTTTIVDYADLQTTNTNDAATLAENFFGFRQIGHAGASNLFNTWNVNSQVLAFMVAGQSPQVEVGLGTTGSVAFSAATLSGYLVDAP